MSLQDLEGVNHSSMNSGHKKEKALVRSYRGGATEQQCTQNLSGSFQILLGKIQKDHTQDVSYPELVVCISSQRVVPERYTCWPKCGDGPDSTR